MGVIEQAGKAVADHQRQQRSGTAATIVYRGDQMFRVNRLGQEVIAPKAHGMQLFGNVFLRRKVNDRHAVEPVLLADHPRDLHAGAAGHVHVQNDDLWRERFQCMNDFHGVGDDVGIHAGLFQHRLHELGLGARIIQHQNLVGLHRIAMGVGFNFFDQLAGVNCWVKEFLATASGRPQAGLYGAVLIAHEDDGNGSVVAFLKPFNGGNPAKGLAAVVNIHQDGFWFVECTGFDQLVGGIECRRTKAEKLKLADQAAGHFFTGQSNIDRRPSILLGGLAGFLVGPS